MYRPVVVNVGRETVSGTTIDVEEGEFEAVRFESGWFVVRETRSRGENGQWIASRLTVEVER